MADQDRIQTRLQNIRAVEPIFGAMRTISLGNWQGAISRQGRIQPFGERLIDLLPAVLTHLARQRRRQKSIGASRIAVLVIGSERGLCGAFNMNLSVYVQAQLAQYRAADVEVELYTLGRRIQRILKRRGISIAESRPLPTTSLPGRDLATELIDCWLADYEAYKIDAVDVIYNAYRNSTLYEQTTLRLLPPRLPALDVNAQSWPPPYIDTDAVALYTHIIQLWTATEMYRILLDSAAAEHAARFQLMEAATQNAERLIVELTQLVQSARKQAITQETQELAVSAGLIGTVPDR
ncbi:MAG: F0F1 ATP synthase subunit gamma [Anaerolineae bacterium]|nr:F0F1 ATP synthase subunit gamma [Anaerolineae bacterium]